MNEEIMTVVENEEVEAVVVDEEPEKSGKGFAGVVIAGLAIAGGAVAYAWHKTKGKREDKREARAIRKLEAKGYVISKAEAYEEIADVSEEIEEDAE